MTIIGTHIIYNKNREIKVVDVIKGCIKIDKIKETEMINEKDNIILKYDENGLLHGYNTETGEEIGVIHETGDEFQDENKVSKVVSIFRFPKITNVIPLENYKLYVSFEDRTEVIYNVGTDIEEHVSYRDLKLVPGLFQNLKIDESRTRIYWRDDIDLPSDMIYEYGDKL